MLMKGMFTAMISTPYKEHEPCKCQPNEKQLCRLLLNHHISWNHSRRTTIAAQADVIGLSPETESAGGEERLLCNWMSRSEEWKVKEQDPSRRNRWWDSPRLFSWQQYTQRLNCVSDTVATSQRTVGRSAHLPLSNSNELKKTK